MSANRPVLLHIPHSSVEIPAEALSWFLLDAPEIERELLVMTDHYTDELFVLECADRLVFPVSRVVVDPERFRADADEPMAERGMGAVYAKTHDGRALKRVPDREALVRRYYDPHHERLDDWAAIALASHGAALLIDCHSYPSNALACDRNQAAHRPDACVGTDEFHTPAWLVSATVAALESNGWRVQVDEPYSGTMTPNTVFHKDPRLVSIMVEINRALYMDESTGKRLAGFSEIRSAVGKVLAAIAEGFDDHLDGVGKVMT